jgi:DNA ligase D-like protein (predicted 3'-phosphoesterase)
VADKDQGSLKDYRKRRDLRKSPEPGDDRGSSGSRKEGRRPTFVIQEHRASSHHFDFRIEVDGVLKSWAVPKGPSTDPRDKRLAVAVEDHPLAYADFEGKIPEGEYGAGSVIVWDRGPYRNLRTNDDGDPLPVSEQIDGGHVEIWLEGKKLQGGYALVHSKLGGKRENWLLVKMKDEEADARRNPVSTQRESVLSGRTVDEIAGESDEDG